MEKRLVSLLGTSATHILRALRRAFFLVAATGAITFVIVALGTEVIAFFLTNHQFPPSGATNLATAALAIALAYAAGITVAVAEILHAIIKTVELIVEESEKLAAAAVKEGEVLLREGGEEALRLGRGALHEAGAVGREVGTLGRGAVSEVGTLGRDAAGVVGGISGAVGGAVGGVVKGVENHLPGHHTGAVNAPSEQQGTR